MTTRLAGHTLEREGRVLIDSLAGYGGGPGVSNCSCGATSPYLGSAALRQAWHRDHKDDLRAGGDDAVWTGMGGTA